MSVEHQPPSTYILRDLHDVPVPESVNWWPQTVGWKVLALVMLALALYWCVRRAKRWWKNRYRNEAIDAIEKLNITDASMPLQLFTILKIVLVYLDSANRACFGQGFISAINSRISNDRAFDTALSDSWMESLINPNRALNSQQRQALIEQAKRWVEWHHMDVSNSQANRSEEYQ